MKTRLVRLTAVAALLAATLGVGAGYAAAQPAAAAECAAPVTGEYATADPAAAGFDARKLQRALRYAAVQGSSTVKVFRHGCLVGQGARDPLFDRVPALQAGQTKTFVALVAGIVADRGWVDLDAPIGRYLPPDLGDAAHRAVTIRQLLHETSGARLNQLRGLNFFLDQSRARQFFSMKLEHPPGQYFQFNETTPSVVVNVLQRAIDRHEPGLDFQEFTQRELFDPLGIPKSAYFWQRDRAGTTTGYSQLYLRPLAYGRLGLLMLHQGRYAGHRIVSEGFIRQLRTGSAANCGFGFYVWSNGCEPGQTQVNTDFPSRRTYPGQPWIASAPSDMYFSLGLGTFTFVIPSLDMIVTRSGYQELDTLPGVLRGDLHGAFPGNAGGPGAHRFFRLLMDAVQNMPDDVRASIANSGPYDRPRDFDVDADRFIEPLGAAPGSYGGIGPRAPEGCRPRPLGCAGEPNNGYRRWIGDVPRVVPGIVGREQRPGGQ